MKKQTNTIINNKLTNESKSKIPILFGVKQIQNNSSNLNKTNINLNLDQSKTSSSSLMSIRADTVLNKQQKINISNNNKTQVNISNKSSDTLRLKSKLYKSTSLDKKQIPSFKSIKKTSLNEKNLNKNLSINSNDNNDSLHNQSNKTETEGINNSNLNKQENENVLMEDESLYEKVFLNSNSKKVKVDQSLESFKESINNFKKKFTNIPKLNTNLSDTNSINKTNDKHNINNNSVKNQQVKQEKQDLIEDTLITRTIIDEFKIDEKSSSLSFLSSPMNNKSRNLEITKQNENNISSDETNKTIDTTQVINDIENIDLNKNSSLLIEERENFPLKSDSLIRKKFQFDQINKNNSTRDLFNDLKNSTSISFKVTAGSASNMLNSKNLIRKSSAKSNSNIYDSQDITNKIKQTQSQEEILEEFKNSLNELIKASKWSGTHTNNTPPATVVSRCKKKQLSIYGTSLNLDENETILNESNNCLLKKSSTTLSNNKLIFNIDKYKSSEFLKQNENLSTHSNNQKSPQARLDTKETSDSSLQAPIVSPLSSTSNTSNSSRSSLSNFKLTNKTENISSSTLVLNQSSNFLINKTKNSIKLKSGDLSLLNKNENDCKNIDVFQHFNQANKRFSTTSEILTKKSNNQDTLDKIFSPYQTLNTSESLSSFKSIDTNYCKFKPKMINNNNNSNNSSENTKFKSSASNLELKDSTLSSQQSIPQRKSANSWIAQSFRKAFSKIDNRRKINKSQTNLNLNQSGKNNSTLSINKNENLNEINSSNSNSKRSSLSEDENHTVIQKNRHTNKLSQIPSSNDKLDDTDSDFDEDLYKNETFNRNKNSLLMTKRSFRSESELALKSNSSKQSITNNNTSKIESLNIQVNTLNERFTNGIFLKNSQKDKSNKIADSTNKQSKLVKTHKSVSSLLTPSLNIEHKQIGQQLANQNMNLSQQKLYFTNKSQSSPNTKCNCKLNESLTADLKKKLNIAENKLTDIRLEALSSVHQIDQLKECLDKMRNEMISLKSENQLLKKYIKEYKCQNVDLNKQQHLNNKLKNLDFDHLNLDDNQNDLSSKIEEMFQFINNNLNNYYYSYNFLLSDENESLLRKALVTIECSYQLNLTEYDNTPDYNYKVCTVNIDSKLKWPLMDGIVTYVFKRYLNKIDPLKLSGLDRNSIDKYIIGDLIRKINDPSLPDLLPFGYLVGNNCNIKIILKDDLKHLDLLSYETMIPKYFLEDYVSIMEKFKLICINSLFKFGKTYLMHKIAQFMTKNLNKEIDILYINVEELTSHLNLDESGSNLNKILMNKIDSKLDELKQNEFKSLIILLDNFQFYFTSINFFKDSSEILSYFQQVKNKFKVYIVLTTNETCYSEDSNSNIQISNDFYHNFKLINLNQTQWSILNYYLNRNLINYQIDQFKMKESCAIMEKVVWFIVEVYKQINEFISKFGLNKFLLTPLNFMNLPFGIESSEKWFIELWNYTVLPYLNDILKLFVNEEICLNIKQNDPTDWIIKNYVWPKNSNSIPLSQRLMKLKLNENYKFKTTRSSSSSDDSDLTLDQNSSNQHLVSMLLRLQKATSLNKEENFSSGFYESTSSNSSTSSTSPNFLNKQTNMLTNTSKNKIESSL